jgi:hypothetical protein
MQSHSAWLRQSLYWGGHRSHASSESILKQKDCFYKYALFPLSKTEIRFMAEGFSLLKSNPYTSRWSFHRYSRQRGVQRGKYGDIHSFIPSVIHSFIHRRLQSRMDLWPPFSGFLDHTHI